MRMKYVTTAIFYVFLLGGCATGSDAGKAQGDKILRREDDVLSSQLNDLKIQINSTSNLALAESDFLRLQTQTYKEMTLRKKMIIDKDHLEIHKLRNNDKDSGIQSIISKDGDCSVKFGGRIDKDSYEYFVKAINFIDGFACKKKKNLFQ